MRKMFLVAIICLCAWPSFGQSEDMHFYYPDGKRYKRACKSIADINADFDGEGRIKTFSPMCWDTTRYDCFIVIGYRLFTAHPVWVFTNSPKNIAPLVNSFKYQEYLRSSEFDHDLTDFIRRKTLTEAFILETLGPPNTNDRIGDVNKEFWTYTKFGLILTFDQGRVTDYQRLVTKPYD